ncbi:hypothetical protein COY95_04290 [Candidatus Woesearchaeota archaeon CG_4_10_14_0_8_um_filter_47_5]|nr:MAG: hypothetical protein COY95_04290 [Candidatus Woesearchaeota archaeon CG_4_10_14_0_8_um_filter_47_5]
MWIAKLRIRHDDWILDKTLKYNLTASGIPLNSYKKNGKQYHNGMVFLNGAEENKQKFINSLRKDQRIKKSKAVGSQVYVLIESEDHIAPLMDDALFFIKPVFFEKGYEYWELGSWEKKPIKEFYTQIKKIAEVKILKLRQENPSVFVQHAVPRLTEKQKRALELALENGYYTYPRTISVEELAQKAGMPRTTFQEHLRKGEAKLMHLLINSLS